MAKLNKRLSVLFKRFYNRSTHYETITALKKKIHMLELSQSRTENYLNNIIRVIPANIYWKDLNSVILGGNLSHAQQAGFDDPKDVLGKTEYDFVWKAQAADIINNDKKIIASGVGSQLEEYATLADGTLHTYLTCKDPLRDKDNNIIGIIGVSTDITEFKKLQQELIDANKRAAEAAAQALQLKANTEEELRKTIMILVGDIVHDLRTPMTTIKVITNFLEKILPACQEIIEDAKRLGSHKIHLLSQNSWDYLFNKTPITDIQNAITLMNDFIDTTLNELANADKALSAELTQEQLSKISSRKIIDTALMAYPFAPTERDKIFLATDYAFDFMGNSILMMKILFNLIKNALEQISLNKVGDITISTAADAHYNFITVKDTAGGAPQDVRDSLFNGYFSTKKGGTGIGLAFCKNTMQVFGGDIECESVAGEFIAFTLKFPKCLQYDSEVDNELPTGQKHVCSN